MAVGVGGSGVGVAVGGMGVAVGVGVAVGGMGVAVGVSVAVGVEVAAGVVVGLGTCAVSVAKTTYAIAVSVALRSGVGCGAQHTSNKTLSNNPNFFISSLLTFLLSPLAWRGRRGHVCAFPRPPR